MIWLLVYMVCFVFRFWGLRLVFGCLASLRVLVFWQRFLLYRCSDLVVLLVDFKCLRMFVWVCLICLVFLVVFVMSWFLVFGFALGGFFAIALHDSQCGCLLWWLVRGFSGLVAACLWYICEFRFL